MNTLLSLLFLLLSAMTASAADVIQLTPILKERGYLGFAACWQSPTNGVWVAEWSTNTTNWTRCSNETVYSDGTRFTETGSDWTGQFFVRLRKLR